VGFGESWDELYLLNLAATEVDVPGGPWQAISVDGKVEEVQGLVATYPYAWLTGVALDIGNTQWAANNGNNFSWWGAFAKNLFSWKNFTDEFKQGGCVNVAVNATAGALNPFSPSLATAGEATAGVLAASQYNAAVQYAASAPNYLGGTGLIYPMKSSVVRGMLADANATAAEAPLFAVDGALLQGVIAEGISMANGECH
jgi:hypothetical protein